MNILRAASLVYLVTKMISERMNKGNPEAKIVFRCFCCFLDSTKTFKAFIRLFMF